MKKVLGLLCIIFITLTVFLVWKQNKSEPKNPYLEKGYTEEEVRKIETLNEANQSYLLETDYQSNILEYLSATDFKEENLKEYIRLGLLYGLSIEDTMYIVNHQYNDIETYDAKTVAFMHEPYYIHEYLERYLNYSNNHQDFETSSVITNVNSNLDYAFYTQDYTVDLDKRYLILVNKYYKLSSDYVPDNLVTIEAKYGKSLSLESTVYEQYKLMWNAAKQEGLNLYICSPYRSYSTQLGLYNNYVAQDGKVAADTYSARAGYSEHQTGLAFDVITPTSTLATFQYTKEFEWIKVHAHEYGFILRYPEGKEYLTGYVYEPWHYRYVGVDVATKIYETGLTYEEYYAYYVR